MRPWPDSWFEAPAACLWCGCTACDTVVDGVEDWFFGAVPGSFAYARCRDCASLVLQKRPVAAHLQEAYAGYYTHQQAATGGAAQRLWRRFAAGYTRHRFGGSKQFADRACAAVVKGFAHRRVAIDEAHRCLPLPPASVLDYGCGNGDFLTLAARLGHQVTGVDFDADALAQARGRGLCVYLPEELAALPTPPRFDYISASHVVEHVPDPAALLCRFARCLKPGGMVFLEMPNAQAAGLAQHGRFWRGLEAPRHFSLPSEQGLRLALERAGLGQMTFGQRAFGRAYMDAASAKAAADHPERAAGAERLSGLAGPEILTVLATAG